MWKNETKLLLNFWLYYVISLLINSNGSSLYIKLSWLLIDNRIMLSVTMGFFVMNNKNTLISEMIVFSTIRSRSTKARALPNNVFWHGNRDFSYLTACNDLANIWSKQALISISYLIKVNICFQDLP